MSVTHLEVLGSGLELGSVSAAEAKALFRGSVHVVPGSRRSRGWLQRVDLSYLTGSIGSSSIGSRHTQHPISGWPLRPRHTPQQRYEAVITGEPNAVKLRDAALARLALFLYRDEHPSSIVAIGRTAENIADLRGIEPCASEEELMHLTAGVGITAHADDRTLDKVFTLQATDTDPIGALTLLHSATATITGDSVAHFTSLGLDRAEYNTMFDLARNHNPQTAARFLVEIASTAAATPAL